MLTIINIHVLQIKHFFSNFSEAEASEYSIKHRGNIFQLLVVTSDYEQTKNYIHFRQLLVCCLQCFKIYFFINTYLKTKVFKYLCFQILFNHNTFYKTYYIIILRIYYTLPLIKHTTI